LELFNGKRCAELQDPALADQAREAPGRIRASAEAEDEDLVAVVEVSKFSISHVYLNGRDLRKLPLHQRKAELKKVVSGTEIQYSESFEIDGQAMFEHACKIGLDGGRVQSPR
jgi:ATP-dependent DNA ligase